MSKKVKVLIAVMLAILLVAAGSTVVMAQEEPEPTPEAGAKGLFARVAEILGEDISEQDLIDAFKQARQEMRQEAFIQALGRAVEKGRITQGEADQIIECREQRPEVMDQIRLSRFCAPPALGQCYMWREHNEWHGLGLHRPPVD